MSAGPPVAADTPAAQQILHGPAIVRIRDQTVEIDFVGRGRQVTGRDAFVHSVWLNCWLHGDMLTIDYGMNLA